MPCSSVFLYTLFYKNKLYKNTKAEICPKIKNKLRTLTSLKFWSENLKNLFNSCTRIEMNRKQNLPEFSLVIGRRKSDKQARHDRGRCIDSFKFFRWMKQ